MQSLIQLQEEKRQHLTQQQAVAQAEHLLLKYHQHKE
jgi:hypothetical protein